MSEGSDSWKKARTTGQWAQILGKHGRPLQKDWLAVVAASTRRGKLPEKIKHLIWTAVDSVVNHLYAPGAALHAEEALAAGATIPELMDTLRIACLPTITGLQDGYALLAEALDKPGAGAQTGAGDWTRAAERLSPEFLSAYRNFADSRMPGGLDARNACMVTLAVLSCPAIMDREKLKVAIRQALDLGIDNAEILEAMELASLIGTHAFANSLDKLSDALDAHAGRKSA